MTIGQRMTPAEAEQNAARWAESGRTVEVVDASKMLLVVVVQETPTGETEMRAEAPNCDKPTAAAILRYVADQWDPERVGTIQARPK